jgi:dimeric dUTPase (all-alpha-NTP-PPase superfamily)
MLQQLHGMLELQDAMNQKVHAQWREQGYAWPRAIWVESAELLEHYGWKWWKKQHPDHEQVALELVDIWHFGLSWGLQTHQEPAALVAHLEAGLAQPQGPDDFKPAVEHFVVQVLSSSEFPAPAFAQLMRLVGLSFEDLYRLYIGKNMLNFFRQNHGYKDGSYKKIWQGREDNEHLMEIIKSLDVQSPSFKDAVYAALLNAYAHA